jgi:alpha-beta hydrolase superfamily lysophospholipase
MRYVCNRETDVLQASKHFSQWLKDQTEFVNKMLKSKDYAGKNVVTFGDSKGGNVAAAL